MEQECLEELADAIARLRGSVNQLFTLVLEDESGSRPSAISRAARDVVAADPTMNLLYRAWRVPNTAGWAFRRPLRQENASASNSGSDEKRPGSCDREQ